MPCHDFSTHSSKYSFDSLLTLRSNNRRINRIRKFFDPTLTLTEEVEVRYRTETRTDSEGNSYTVEVSDIVVLHRDGRDAAHYVDSIGYREVPEFFKEQGRQLTPDELETGETVKTPRGTFYVTAMSREQMEAAGYGLHHQSEDGKYLIMGNGTRAFAIPAEQPEKVNPLKHVEDTVEQNDNAFDGLINNTPQTPTAGELEQKVKAGEPISLADYAAAIKAEKERGGAKQEKPLSGRSFEPKRSGRRRKRP